MDKLQQLWKKLFLKPKKEVMLRLKGVDGGIGSNNPNECTSSNFVLPASKIDKRPVLISLTKLNIQDSRGSGFLVDISISPVNYQSYKIWLIYSTAFWYAIECYGNYYAFDIREVVEKMGLLVDFDRTTVEDICLHHREWMERFAHLMENSHNQWDVKQSILASYGK